MDHNSRLAELLGWTNIITAGTALLGTPPAGAGSSRGQAAVPDWRGDWAACAPLMGLYSISVNPMSVCVTAAGTVEFFHKHCDRDAAIRCAIVLAAISKLEREKK